MGSIRARPDTGKLFLDFRYNGKRCREQTALPDTKSNRRKVEKLLQTVEEQIADGSFDYARTFPSSSTSPPPRPAQSEQGAPAGSVERIAAQRQTPLFEDFAETWYHECLPQWRPLHQEAVRGVLDKYLIPHFGDREIAQIRRPNVLDFRARLSRKPGRRGKPLGNSRINKIMTFLRQILNEAAIRYELSPAFQGIKPLKVAKTDVHPFSLVEVNQIVENCRPDFRNYFIVRFFSGMRTGEIHGLRWRHVDFDNGLILIRETLVKGKIQKGAKTYESCREIPMLPIVKQALLAHRKATPPDVEWVFWNNEGGPLDAHNFVKRVWTPLLAYLGLEYRRPYQTRHTTATLMLAAGEAPEWIARVLGHTSTEMLFKTYSRYVPNLTRRDGSAMNRLLAQQVSLGSEES